MPVEFLAPAAEAGAAAGVDASAATGAICARGGGGEGVDHVGADEGVVHVASDRDGWEEQMSVPCAEAVAHGIDENVRCQAGECFVRDYDGSQRLEEEREAWVGRGYHPGPFLKIEEENGGSVE